MTVVALVAGAMLDASADGGSATGSRGGTVTYAPYDPTPEPTPDEPTPEPTPTVTVSPDPNPPDGDVQELLTHIPGEIARSCVKDPGFEELVAGLRVAVVCQNLGPDYADTMNYLLYDSDSSMEAAFDYVVTGFGGGLPKATSCEDGPAHGRWRNGDGVEAGNFACYKSSVSGFRLWWTADGSSILARAADEEMSVRQLWPWFMNTSTGPF